MKIAYYWFGLLVSASIGLSGCAQKGLSGHKNSDIRLSDLHRMPEQFTVNARFSLQLPSSFASYDDETLNYTGRLYWKRENKQVDSRLLVDSPETKEQQIAPKDYLLFSSPFGQAMAELTRHAGWSILGQGGTKEKIWRSEDDETLMRQHLGYSLPIDALAAWLFGQADQNAKTVYGPRGRILSFIDDGWHVSYEYDDSDPVPDKQLVLAKRIKIKHQEAFDLRLRVENWQIQK